MDVVDRRLDRGLRGVKLVVSDDHAGPKAAREATLSGIPWQRCQFHTIRKAITHVPKALMKGDVTQDIKRIFNADDIDEANRRLKEVATRYRTPAPALADWLEANIPEALTVLNFPAAHRRRLRTSNSIERLTKEIKRRTRVATLFPNEASLLRLVSAVLSEISDNWEAESTAKTCWPTSRARATFPFEKAQHNSNTYDDWFLDRPYMLVPLQQAHDRPLRRPTAQGSAGRMRRCRADLNALLDNRVASAPKSGREQDSPRHTPAAVGHERDPKTHD